MKKRTSVQKLVLLVLAAVLCLGGWLIREQRELADSMIRLHVVANSDGAEDQRLKLAVRDRVLEAAAELCPEHATLEQARAALSDNLGLLSRVGQQVVRDWGRTCSVSARLEKCWFPTKEYEGFALPAGTYNALNIIIGEGAGQNWWCVAFPPLCLGAAAETVESAVQSGAFTQEQAALMTEEQGGYVLKFRCMEFLGRLQEFFCRPGIR